MAVMKLKFLGVRGSWPTHKPGLLGFGGNSTSMQFLLPDEDFCVFLDGGSGLAQRGAELGVQSAKSKFYFVITHTHWDHILGFPFFKPFHNPKNKFTFYASQTSKATFNELFFGLQRASNLPIPISALQAQIAFHPIRPAEPFVIEGKLKVQTYQINHQGITLSYRLSYGDDSVAVVTDNAPIEKGNHLGEGMKEAALADPLAFEERFNAGMVAYLQGCHTVVFDTHFTEENLKPDWGHSTPSRAVDYCLAAGVKRLILFHHAPEELDADVEAKVASVRERASAGGLTVVAAREGDEWELR